MSIVNAVIIKDRKIRFARKHYREIMGILDKKMPRAKKPIDLTLTGFFFSSACSHLFSHP